MGDKIYGKMVKGDTHIAEIRKAINGWTVVAVGKTETYKDESDREFPYNGYVEGGLTLMLYKDGVERKVILGYTELGEWLEHME
jgi:hypothetical protein